MNNSKSEWLGNILEINGLSIPNENLKKLSKFTDLLLEKNKVINLISRKDEESVWESHILHSLALLILFEFKSNTNVMDLGTGGGLPGIPIKIVNDTLKMDLVDSINKKVNAIQFFIKQLELSDARAICSRAENLGRNYYGNYDVIICRAVAPLKDLIRWANPLLRKNRNNSESKNVNGKILLSSPTLLAMKGGNLDSELHEVKDLERIQVIDINIKGLETDLLHDKKVVKIIF